ncbi:MAG: trypsin-like peptidase domain-containing protein [Limisphaerales bacterium]
MRSFIATLLASACLGSAASPRETPTVKLIKQLDGAVFPIFSEPERGRLTSGTASVIHPEGFLLSNDHVMLGKNGVVLVGRERVEFRVIGRLPGKDLAILVVKDNTKLKGVVPIGRSHDLMNGEPIIAAGNPGGRGLVYTTGIISAATIMRDVNALMMSYFKSGRDEFIQFDAASNPGNSGGPLINALGRQIGIVSAGVPGEENINYAIPIDRVRKLFSSLLPIEVRANFWTGVTVDFMTQNCRITHVVPNSPASKASLKKGDVIKKVNDHSVRDGLDWPLSLVKRKRLEPISIGYLRKGKEYQAEIKPVAYPLASVAKKDGKKSGLKFSVYHGSFGTMPDFKELKAMHKGVTENLKTESLVPDRDERFAIVFEGYLAVPKTGLYWLNLGSDDGSKLFLDGRLLIDNDHNHPMQQVSNLTRLKAGLHKIRLEYFDYTGDAELELQVSGDGIKEQMIPDNWFYHD